MLEAVNVCLLNHEDIVDKEVLSAIYLEENKWIVMTHTTVIIGSYQLGLANKITRVKIKQIY